MADYPRAELSQLVKNVLSSYLVRFVVIAIDLLLFPLMSFYLGMEKLGTWFIIQNSIALLMRSDLGLGAAAIRYVANTQAKQDTLALRKVVNTSLAFFIVIGVAATIALISGAQSLWSHLQGGEWTSEISVVVWVVAIGNMLIGLPLSIFRQVLIGLRRYDLMNLLRICESVLRAILFATVLYLGTGIIGVAIVDSSLFIITSIMALKLCRRVDSDVTLDLRYSDLRFLKMMMPYSLQVSAMSLLTFVILETDSLVVGAVVSVPMVAVYTAGYKFYQGAKEMTSALVQPFVPDAAHASSLNDSERLRTVLLQGTKLGLALTLALAVPIMLFSDQFVGAWAGPSYTEATPVIRVLLLGLLVSNLHLVAAAILRGTGQIGSYLVLHVLWALSNLGLSIVLGKEYGILGVALGTTLPILFLEPFYIGIALKALSVAKRQFFMEAVLDPCICGLLASAATAMLLWLVGPPSTSLAFILSAVYGVLFLVLFLTLGMSRTERLQALQILRGFSSSRPSRKRSLDTAF